MSEQIIKSMEQLIEIAQEHAVLKGQAAVLTSASLEAVRICTDHMDENLKLKKALSGMLFAFDDGVGRDWSADLLDYARKLTPAAEFKI